MLKNAYSLAKIVADTAENEGNFAKNMPQTIGNYPSPSAVAGRVAGGLYSLWAAPAGAGALHRRRCEGPAGTWERDDPKFCLAIPYFFCQI